MNWKLLMALGVLGAAACSGGNNDDDVDSDGDGLTDEEERAFGSNPNDPDSDGDGVLDLEERDLNLDPNSEDTDGDGYRDLDELTEGKDPTDADSKIYIGGWPYNAKKDDIVGVVPELIQKGELFVHFTAKDQFTDTVDVWDFQNDEGKYIIIDISAQWCGPCNSMALWMDGGVPEWDVEWPGIHDAVNNGDVYWITVLGEMNNGNTARQKTTEQWYEEYPNPNIPILADTDYTTALFADLTSWPTIIVLNPDLTVAWMPTGDEYWVDGMDWMVKKL